MKDYTEMAESVLNRRDSYVIERRKKMKKLTATISCFCLCLCALLGVGAWQSGVFENAPTDSTGLAVSTEVADVAPMVYVNDTLYKQALDQVSYDTMKDDFDYLGAVQSDITDSQNITDGVPKENYQANHPIVGASIFRYDKNIVVLIDGEYWLYEMIDSKTSPTAQDALTEEEKMQLDPSYNGN